MTQAQFLSKLRKMTLARQKDGNALTFAVDTGGDLRCGPMCPITFIHGQGFDAGDVADSADALGIPERLKERIIASADLVRDSHYSSVLRQQMFAAVGLL